MDQGVLTGAVFIDLRKAFDSVYHNLLVNKLETYGLFDKELSSFCSYLPERIQVVSVRRELSDPCYITSGVPQDPHLAHYCSCCLSTTFLQFWTSARQGRSQDFSRGTHNFLNPPTPNPQPPIPKSFSGDLIKGEVTL